MKQRISTTQWLDLPDLHKDELFSWLKSRKYNNSYFRTTDGSGLKPTIGQLLEFIYTKKALNIYSEERESQYQGWYVNEKPGLELIDALWANVKDILCNK